MNRYYAPVKRAKTKAVNNGPLRSAENRSQNLLI